MQKLALSAAVLAFAASSYAAPHVTEPGAVHEGPMGFPEFNQPNIPGAPKLGKPMLIMGDKLPVLTEKHGLAAPELYDWNGDGKRDLLLGEFETETDPNKLDEKASAIRVYLNIGTDSNPKFSDEFEYARDINGAPLAVAQW